MRRVYEAMTKNVLWLNPDSHISEANKLMQEFGIRHLPVVDGFKVVGMVSQGDIQLHSYLDRSGDLIMENKTVGEIMSQDVVTCSPANYLAHVAATMIACKISCLPVVKNGELVGIVTTTDILDMYCLMEEENGHAVMPLDYTDHSRHPSHVRIQEGA